MFSSICTCCRRRADDIIIPVSHLCTTMAPSNCRTRKFQGDILNPANSRGTEVKGTYNMI